MTTHSTSANAAALKPSGGTTAGTTAGTTGDFSALSDSLYTKGGICHTSSPANLLREDVSLPAAVIYAERLQNNLDWMQRFANSQRVRLAPHGKTTMTPAFFARQQQAGAWALTLATAPQVAAAYNAGVRRILMANQLVGKRNMGIISELLAAEHGGALDFYCLVDSVDNVHQLGRFFSARNQQLQVLLEIGVAGGRCGCRTPAQIQQVVAALADYPCLKLAGVETYEGVIGGGDAANRVRAHLEAVRDICLELIAQQAFTTEEVILTGAGSAWYDLVAEVFGAAAGADGDGQNQNPDPVETITAAHDHADSLKHVHSVNIVPVIRPGCYLIHDKGIYETAQHRVMERLAARCDISGDLVSSLELWAYVQSVPEPGRAVLGLGKRDVAFDAGLPQPALLYRPGNATPHRPPIGAQVVSIMDHHSMMALPATADVRVGDMVALSTSHPCLTFDKWRELSVIDEHYNVVERVTTYF